MNIKDLQNIDIKDLKNIDWASAKNRLLSQPNKILNIALICVTVLTVITVYRMWAKTSKTLKAELTQQQEKVEALDKYKATQKKFREFLDKAPKTVSENRLIELLSEIALNSGVQIVSLSPTVKSSDNFSNLTSIKITISSENYSDIIRFMYKLENSENLIRIKNWNGALGNTNTQKSRRYGWGGTGASRYSTSDDNKNGTVQVTVEIETLEFKNA